MSFIEEFILFLFALLMMLTMNLKTSSAEMNNFILENSPSIAEAFSASSSKDQ